MQAHVDLILSNIISSFQINGQFSTLVKYGLYSFSIWRVFLLNTFYLYSGAFLLSRLRSSVFIELIGSWEGKQFQILSEDSLVSTTASNPICGLHYL